MWHPHTKYVHFARGYNYGTIKAVYKICQSCAISKINKILASVFIFLTFCERIFEKAIGYFYDMFCYFYDNVFKKTRKFFFTRNTRKMGWSKMHLQSLRKYDTVR